MEKLDKRVAKTRFGLQRALIDLMVERGYEYVTVQHVLDRAGVGRATFYSHYRDKEDLLRGSLDNLKAALTHHWRQSLASESKEVGELRFVLPFLQHLNGSRHIWRAIVGREVGSICDRQMRRMLAEMARADLGGSVPATSLEATVQFVVGGLMSLATWWLDYEIALSPEVVSGLFVGMAMRGVGSV